MKTRSWPLVAAVAALAHGAWAQSPAEPWFGQQRPNILQKPRMALEAEPLHAPTPRLEPFVPRLMQRAQEPSVYSLPAPGIEEHAGANTGGIRLDLEVRYFTDYVYRGVIRSDFIGDVTSVRPEERANFQIDGRLMFDLGKLPHPFIGAFANVLDADPVSNFQEVRPFFGAEWRIRPLIIEAGNNTYIFPDRNELNTSEVYGRVTLDDAAILRRERPLLSPYILVAYDFDLYDGWYFETGVSHTFIIEDTSLTLTPTASVAYVRGHGAFAGPLGEDDGFQHYQLGLIARYGLNTLLNIPMRYGQWSFNGYIFYTDGIDNDLRADTQLWGGAGIQLTY